MIEKKSADPGKMQFCINCKFADRKVENCTVTQGRLVKMKYTGNHCRFYKGLKEAKLYDWQID